MPLDRCRTVQAIALDPELHFRVFLQPGDVQWVHNTTMMHTRDGFTDGEVIIIEMQRYQITLNNVHMLLRATAWCSEVMVVNGHGFSPRTQVHFLTSESSFCYAAEARREAAPAAVVGGHQRQRAGRAAGRGRAALLRRAPHRPCRCVLLQSREVKPHMFRSNPTT